MSKDKKLKVETIMGDKHNMFISSDSYFNNPSRWESYEDFSNPIPVDSAGAFVPTQKHNAMNLKNAQSSIHERFDLHTSGELNPEDGF